MESRGNVYYNRNTVRPPKIKKECKNLIKNSKVKFFDRDKNGRPFKNPNKYMPKVCATSKCLWCDFKFEEWRTICQSCHNCQFCGFYSSSPNACNQCGNKASEEIEIKIKRYVF